MRLPSARSAIRVAAELEQRALELAVGLLWAVLREILQLLLGHQRARALQDCPSRVLGNSPAASLATDCSTL